MLAAAVFLCAPSAGVAATPEALFRQGVTAARAGDYGEAIEHFEAARRAGLDTGALHYNLGVAYYHAGRLEPAEAAFRRAVDSDSMVAPAWYQLGRLARERGDDARAREHFRRAAAEAQTDALRRRARAALARAAAVTPPEYVYVAAGGGHDSNVSLTPDDASGVSEESDFFVEGLAVARQPLNGPNYLRASGYTQVFLDDDDFDVTSVRGGIGRVGRLQGPWRWDAYVDGRHLRFGGETFENSLFLGGAVERGLGGRWSLDLGLRLELTDGGSDFEFLDGTGHRFEAVVDERGAAGWRLEAALETLDRDDRETADDFFSFSRDELEVAARYGLDLDRRARVTFEGDWSHRDYDGTEIRNGTRLDEREDDRIGLGVTLHRRFDANWGVRLALRLEERDSNLDEFDYDRSLIRAQIERVF